MAKKIQLNVDVTKEGKIVVNIEGTTGTECLTHMAFLDNIPGLTVTETERVQAGDSPVAPVHQVQKIGDK